MYLAVGEVGMSLKATNIIAQRDYEGLPSALVITPG